MQFEYRGPGAPKDIPAEITGSELTRIAQRDGGISPLAVLDESRPDFAPLHSAFEWDDGVAAEEFRQQQARQLIRAVVLVPQPERNETAPVVRAFVSLHNPAGDTPQARHYKPTLEVMANPVEAEEVKRRLRNEVIKLRARYLSILELDESLATAFTALEAAAA